MAVRERSPWGSMLILYIKPPKSVVQIAPMRERDSRRLVEKLLWDVL